MKRFVFVIFAMSFLFLYSGCTGMQIVREVDENNVFISSGRPAIKIKVKDSLKYMEQKKRSKSAISWKGGEKTTNKKINSFYFESNDFISEKLIITLSSLNSSRWYFSSDLLDTSDTLDSGTMMISGKEYQYITYFYKYNSVNYLYKVISRRVGAKNNSKITIYYRESLSEGWPDDLDNNINLLTSEQEAKFRDFSSKFINAFEIL